MPVKKCGKKYRIGNGKCMYKSAERAYAAYRAKKHGAKKK